MIEYFYLKPLKQKKFVIYIRVKTIFYNTLSVIRLTRKILQSCRKKNYDFFHTSNWKLINLHGSMDLCDYGDSNEL